MRKVALVALLLAACGGDDSSGPPVERDLSVSASSDLASSDLASNADASTAGDGAVATTADYASPGPVAYTTSTISAALSSGTVSVVAYVPSSAGTHPVVVMAPGLEQPDAAYATYGQRLASFGILTILVPDNGVTGQASDEAAQVSELVTTWLPTSTLGSGADTSKVGLMGHSRGGEVMLLAAEGGLKGKLSGFFGLDPVDASSGTEARTALSTIGIPSVFLGETLDSSGGFGGMSCAPAADNYQVLYGDAPSPSLQLTAVGGAHVDFEIASQVVAGFLCQTGSADPNAVLDMAVALSTGFFAGVLQGAPVGAELGGAGVPGYVTAGALTLDASK